ncbi:alcohol dehydrogenase catalytic domain-containing protein, partial [Sphingomonas sp. CCH9-F2]
MRALLSRAPGGPETLEIGDLPEPVAAAGEVLVSVKACAINYPDVLVIEDKYQFKPPRPFAPGGEFSGVVESVGEGVTAFSPGDRVMGNTGMGGLVERLVAKADNIYPIPDER